MDGETWESLRFLLNITNWFLNITDLCTKAQRACFLLCVNGKKSHYTAG